MDAKLLDSRWLWYLMLALLAIMLLVMAGYCFIAKRQLEFASPPDDFDRSYLIPNVEKPVARERRMLPPILKSVYGKTEAGQPGQP